MEEIERDQNLLYFKDPLKRSLLYIAARNGHSNICVYLINKGLDINEIQITDSTPIHDAVYYGQANVVKILITYWAQTNIKNKYGHLPKDEAMTEEIQDILKESEKDPIEGLYKKLIKKNLAISLIPIYFKGSIMAKKYYVNWIICLKSINFRKLMTGSLHGMEQIFKT